MSKALDAIKENFENVAVVIEEYNTELEKVKNDLNVKNKALDTANIEQASLMYLYYERYVELKAILNYIDDQLNATKGRLWKTLTEDSNRVLQQKDKEQYINTDSEYLAMRELFIEIEELTAKYAAVVEAFKSRGYVLNNLIRLALKDID